MQIKHRLSYK